MLTCIVQYKASMISSLQSPLTIYGCGGILSLQLQQTKKITSQANCKFQCIDLRVRVTGKPAGRVGNLTYGYGLGRVTHAQKRVAGRVAKSMYPQSSTYKLLSCNHTLAR